MINGKEYTGKHQTEIIDDGYLGSGKCLKRAIKKYGTENFKREVLFIYETEDEMNSKEAELVTEEYCSQDNTYNICPGGRGGFGYINANGLGVSENQKKFSRIQMRKMHAIVNTPEFRHVKIANLKIATKERQRKYPKGTFYLKKHTDVTKQKMRRSKNVGERNSQYGTCWITDGTTNKKIRKEYLDVFIKDGYRKGRVLV